VHVVLGTSLLNNPQVTCCAAQRLTTRGLQAQTIRSTAWGPWTWILCTGSRLSPHEHAQSKLSNRTSLRST
jgi:hypothetical protein